MNPYVGEIFTRIFLFPTGKEMCLCGKIKNLILCAWRFALTPFRSVVVFISDFFAPFFRKTVNFLFFVSLDTLKTRERSCIRQAENLIQAQWANCNGTVSCRVFQTTSFCCCRYLYYIFSCIRGFPASTCIAVFSAKRSSRGTLRNKEYRGRK